MTHLGRTRSVVALALIALTAVVIASCGGSDDAEGPAAGTEVERAFLEGMVPHHESAVEMARVAEDRAQHPELSGLADAIISTQAAEIDEMKKIHKRLFGEALRPNQAAHEELGLNADEAGMAHDGEAAAMLMEEKPFDRAFIDEMVPHHQGAIRMARAVLADGGDAAIRSLAKGIISAQESEIEEMNRWRTAWYGSPSPAGGVPKSEGASEMEGMDGGGMEHEGH